MGKCIRWLVGREYKGSDGGAKVRARLRKWASKKKQFKDSFALAFTVILSGRVGK